MTAQEKSDVVKFYETLADLYKLNHAIRTLTDDLMQIAVWGKTTLTIVFPVDFNTYLASKQSSDDEFVTLCRGLMDKTGNFWLDR